MPAPRAGAGRRLGTTPRAWIWGLCQAEVGVAGLGGMCLSELLSRSPGPRERLPSANGLLGAQRPHPGL